jgi:hypothetical protein
MLRVRRGEGHPPKGVFASDDRVGAVDAAAATPSGREPQENVSSEICSQFAEHAAGVPQPNPSMTFCQDIDCCNDAVMAPIRMTPNN